MNTYSCANKTCPNFSLTFAWDNAAEDVKCRACEQSMAVQIDPKASHPARKAKADNE